MNKCSFHTKCFFKKNNIIYSWLCFHYQLNFLNLVYEGVSWQQSKSIFLLSQSKWVKWYWTDRKRNESHYDILSWIYVWKDLAKFGLLLSPHDTSQKLPLATERKNKNQVTESQVFLLFTCGKTVPALYSSVQEVAPITLAREGSFMCRCGVPIPSHVEQDSTTNWTSSWVFLCTTSC